MAKKISENDNGVIHMGTGKGKSWVIYDTVVKKAVPTLVLTHNINTANAIYEGLTKNTNIETSMLGLSHSQTRKSFTGKVDVTTHATFKKKWKSLIGKYDMILYDECDLNLSFPKRNDYDCMIGALIMMDTKYLYGFTGTPYRADGGAEVLNRVFGEIWTDEDVEKYFHLPVITNILYRYNGSYLFEDRHELREEIMNDTVRVETQVKVVEKLKGKCNLILVKGVEESIRLHSMIKGSILINGQLGVKKTREVESEIDRLDKGGFPYTIVGTIDKIGRGVDIPSIDTLFLFSPVRFRGTVIQAIGRALRKYGAKTVVNVIDWNDVPILNKQAAERRKVYKTEYFAKEFKTIEAKEFE